MDTDQDFVVKLKNFAKGWRNVLTIALILFCFTLILTLIQPLKYRASSRVLIVNKLADPYSAQKSTQYLSDTLAEVIYSGSFLNEVVNSGYNIDQDYFSKNEQKKRKQWNQMIRAKSISDTGMIAINVYHQDKNQASQIAQAVGYILKIKHNLYHGGGDNVFVRVIDKPITSNWPVKPNIAVNLILALVFGLILGAGFVYFFPGCDLGKSFKSILPFRAKKKIAEQSLINESVANNDNGFTKKEELYDRYDDLED